MTVGETLTASSLGGPGGAGVVPASEVVTDARQKPSEVSVVNQQAMVAAVAAVSGTPGSNAGGPNVNVVTAKIGQELVTSLHLIKDIRRLEKYQRDFFLKVRIV